MLLRHCFSADAAKSLHPCSAGRVVVCEANCSRTVSREESLRVPDVLPPWLLGNLLKQGFEELDVIWSDSYFKVIAVATFAVLSMK